jgi:hypothetical protein
VPPTITLVAASPTTLYAGQTDVKVDANIIDDSGAGVTYASALAYVPSTGEYVGSETALTLISGNMLNGIFSGTLVIPPSIIDGTYQIVVFAANALSNWDDFSTIAVNDESLVVLDRGVTGPDQPSPTDGASETNEKEKCFCNVSINVNSGPVNIYVCRSDTKFDIPA